MSTIWYCTREEVKTAMDVKVTSRSNAQIDRLIAAATDKIEGSLHRTFYPELATRYFNWPDIQMGTSYTLWLEENELISVEQILSGTHEITLGTYFLEPANQGPPFESLELNLGRSGWFGQGNTSQHDIAIRGLYGFRNDEIVAGTITASINTSATSVNVSDSSSVGVGSLIRIGTERLKVTGRRMLDTTQNLQTPIAQNSGITTVAVSDGTAFNYDEVIMLDAERMLIEDIAGNNLIVRRAWDGSTLAAHTGSDIYVARTLIVERGVLGTTATTHTSGDVVSKWTPPDLINQLARAETINAFMQENAGYARTIGSGDMVSEARGRGLDDLRKSVAESYKRYRIGVI